MSIDQSRPDSGAVTRPAGGPVVPDGDLAGRLDASEVVVERKPPLRKRFWDSLWPKLAAVALALLAWQLVFWSHWKKPVVLPSPTTTLKAFWSSLVAGDYWDPLATTMSRGALGFAIALALGTVIGLLVSQIRPLRAAVGSLITGLQTMPSIAWYPAAIVLFGLTEKAILFVVLLGATPSIANGIISGVDDLPPSYRRAAKVLGARGLDLYRYVILPAALPAYLGGLKQGWAFAWRSLLAGELLGTVAGRGALGQVLQTDRELSDYPGVYSTMILILIVGMVVDAVFGYVANRVRRNRGLGDLRL